METKNENLTQTHVKKTFNAFLFKVKYTKNEVRKYKRHITITFSGWLLLALLVAIIIYCLTTKS